MTFFNATLILGTLAAVVPIALHLLARREPQRVVFPGVRFLRPKLSSQRSRLRIRRWWLLALRVLAVIALAVALARPHIDSALSSTWWTVGLMGLTGVGFLVLASLAVARGMGRSLAIGVAVAGLVALLASLFLGTRTWATSGELSEGNEQPVAMALLIDNGPSAMRSVASSDGTNSSRLDQAIREAATVIERLPEGSRLAVLDRSATPIGFALDAASARLRLSQMKPLANPLPVQERMDAAVELLRSSDLPGKQLVVVSDWNAASWKPSAQTPAMQLEDVAISMLQVAASDDGSAGASEGALINRFLSPPKLIDAAPAPGVSIPISVSVGMESSASEGQSLNVTVQLSLYERDPSLPVIRDGELVLPRLRGVDRASATVVAGANVELVLTLPPLDLGTHHAVVELVGDDAFEWDDRRFLTLNIPVPPRVLLVGENADERNELGLALTAPKAPDDDGAGFRVAGVAYSDLSAVDWQLIDAVAMIDPPIQIDAASQSVVSGNGLTKNTVDQLMELARRGGGVVMMMGPSTEVLGVARPNNQTDEVDRLLPPLVRSWRVPAPGEFWEERLPSHPILRPLTLLDDQPPWSSFPVNRYWQTEPNVDAGWQTVVRYAGTQHPAILARTIESDESSVKSGRVAVLTTPLPALSKKTRSWNQMFTAADAWPAFVIWRGLMQWATGVSDQATTVLVGATAVVPETDAANRIQRASSPAESTTVAMTEPTVRLYSPLAVESAFGGEPAVSEVDVVERGGVFPETNEVGTTFLRGPDYWGGYSTNLDPVWSQDERVTASEMDLRFGVEQWMPSDSGERLSIQGRVGGSPQVSLHGPMMLLAVIVFLAEQLLSNRFYRTSGAAT
ncbi:putative transmembrane protein [Rhodopirellula islandica]|uniref:Transmembrane protein n=1 Tax=Rhodopirellula islandica TaxID=595434 RepID=A0A0J1B7K9_RHOIS|nr:BatA domain-containing protein [Rhodopirellula islandica]KLU02712.1 putative transmembrane protein [Rhodopirellula islandica]